MSDNVFEKIKNQTDIVTVVSSYQNLDKKGKNYFGICPFHDDTSPSMSVSQDKQIFKCFSCGASGDVIEYVSKKENISRFAAYQKLGEKLDIKIQDNRPKKVYSERELSLFKILKEAQNFFIYSLSSLDDKSLIKKYIQTRNISIEQINKFGIGYAPNDGLVTYLRSKGFDDALLINSGLSTESGHDFFKDRIIFSISDENGNIVGFSGRTLDKNNQAKYINSPETAVFNKSKILFNLNNIIENVKSTKEVIITEGYTDVMSLDSIGISNCVAIMGTAFTREQLFKLPKATKIKLMLDSDKPGLKAMYESIKNIITYNNNIYVIILPNSYDPDEAIKEKGKDFVRTLIQKNNLHWFRFLIEHGISETSKDNPESIKAFLDNLKGFAKYASKLELNMFLPIISEKLNIPLTYINEVFKVNSKPIETKEENISLNNSSKATVSIDRESTILYSLFYEVFNQGSEKMEWFIKNGLNVFDTKNFSAYLVLKDFYLKETKEIDPKKLIQLKNLKNKASIITDFESFKKLVQIQKAWKKF